MGFQPFGIVAQRTTLTQIIVHTMTFNISLIINIQTVLIAKLVKTTVLRIVTQTDRIDISTFHQFKVFTHQVFGHIMSRFRIVLMDINPFQLQRLPVNQKDNIVLSICRFLVYFLNLYPTETYIIRHYFIDFSIFSDSHHQFVEIGSF